MIFYPGKAIFRFERELKSCTDKQKLKEFSTNKMFYKKMLKISLNGKDYK